MTKARKIIFFILIPLAIAAVGVYFVVLKSPAGTLYHTLPSSVASVNGQPIYALEYQKRLSIAKTYYAGGGVNDAQLKEQVLHQLIAEQEIEQLAAKLGIAVRDSELDSEASVIAWGYNKQHNEPVSKLYQTYGISEEEFKQEVVKPSLLKTKLMVWFNSQEDLNKAAFGTLREIQAQLQQNSNFDQLALQYQNSEFKSPLGSDMGFIPLNSLLPELSEQLKKTNPGDTAVLFSRYGIHVVKVEARDEKDGGRVSLKQIFITPGDFTSWLQDQTKNDRVKITS